MLPKWRLKRGPVLSHKQQLLIEKKNLNFVIIQAAEDGCKYRDGSEKKMRL